MLLNTHCVYCSMQQKKETTKKESFEPIHIRFPYDLKKKVQELADKEERTFTQQLIYLVKQSLTKQ